MKQFVVLMLSAALILSACGASKGIEASDAWARMGETGANSAVYFVIQNHNAETDNLVGVSTNIANAAEIHESKMDGDVMMMNHLESVTLDPSKKVEFMPGGLHIMLIGLKQDLNIGDEIEVTLHLENSPDLTLKATVKDPGSSDMQSMDH